VARYALDQLVAAAFPTGIVGSLLVVYGGDPGGAGRAGSGPWVHVAYSPETWTGSCRPAGCVEVAEGGAVIGCDLVAVAFRALTRADEQPWLDNWGRVPWAASGFARGLGDLGRPAVDQAARVMRDAAEKAGAAPEPVPLWDGHRFAVGLSHDVDALRRWTGRGYAAAGAGAARHLLAGRLGAATDVARQVAASLRGRWRRETDPFWTFDQVLETERRHGARSTFFVKARFTHSLDGSDRRTYRRLVGEVCRTVLAAGCEVGLHGSHAAATSRAALTDEKAVLEQRVGTEVRGVRYHNLRFLPDCTAGVIAGAGFAYDSTLAFAERIGYRSGSSFPHRLFDPATGQASEVVEVPLAVMDTTLIVDRYGHLERDAAWKAIVDVLSAAEAAGGGVAVLWHNDQIGPAHTRGLGTLYEDLVAYCAERQAWLTSVGDLAQRWSARLP
jgi:peptidoglycan/xylan/chitin deacetylase (PgdA/CDA1 family)